MVPEDKKVTQRSLAKPDTFFTQHLNSGKVTTTHVGQTSALNNPQAMAWTTIQPPDMNMDQPLLAAVTRDLDAVLAPWRREALIQIGLMVVLTLMCVGGLVAYQRRQLEFEHQEEAARRTMQEQNERFSVASSAARLGFWSYDSASDTVSWDDWMFRLYGRERVGSDQLYDLWVNSVHLADRAQAVQTFTDAIDGCHEFDSEYRIVHPDGSVRHIKAVATAHRDVNGHAIKMFGVSFDVTDIRVSEQKQAQLVRELSRINGELNQFTYVVSHDLKSPLRGIEQLATWIDEDSAETLDSETRERLRLMRTRITRMESLLDDLLAYSRAGRSDQAEVQVNTHDLVQDVFELVATSGKQIHLQVADNMPTLLTQKVPLELVFRNLISNAIKHHDKAQGSISISARHVVDGFEFEVKDDGPGIPPEHQQRVFAMFQTLKPRDEVEGSGIGLAIVRKSVESVGGTVTVASDGVHGCSFRFTWPNNSSRVQIRSATL